MARETVRVRPAGARDHAAWAEMWADYNTFYGAAVSESVTTTTWARILDPMGAVNAVLATNGAGNTLGFANYILHSFTWGDRPVCLLDDLFVRPEARGKGAGRALIEHLIAEGRKEGWARLYWMTREGNETARRLYDRFTQADGFVRYTLSLDAVRPTGGDG